MPVMEVESIGPTDAEPVASDIKVKFNGDVIVNTPVPAIFIAAMGAIFTAPVPVPVSVAFAPVFTIKLLLIVSVFPVPTVRVPACAEPKVMELTVTLAVVMAGS